MAAATSLYTNFVRRFSNLIGRFGEANLALGRGETEVRIPVKGRDGLGELGEKMNAMAVNLQGTIADRERSKQLTTLGQITASVSHELRDPLGTIRTSMFSIRERTRDKDLGINKALDRVDRSLRRYTTIIADLLEFTRSMTAETSATHVDDFLLDVLAEQSLPVGIELTHDHCADATLEIDSVKMIGVLYNLISNAVQAIEAPGRIEVRSRHEDSQVTIEVADSGVGFPEENLAKVFEPLFTTKTRDIGLGMSIVKKVVGLHGGSVRAANNPGGGGLIRIELPETTQEGDVT